MRQKRRIMPHVNARRHTSTHVAARRRAARVMMRHCVENATEIKAVLISALCDARQRALTCGICEWALRKALKILLL